MSQVYREQRLEKDAQAKMEAMKAISPEDRARYDLEGGGGLGGVRKGVLGIRYAIVRIFLLVRWRQKFVLCLCRETTAVAIAVGLKDTRVLSYDTQLIPGIILHSIPGSCW